MTRYKCCQGYFDCCCFKAGSCGEKSCPYFCLCLEVNSLQTRLGSCLTNFATVMGLSIRFTAVCPLFQSFCCANLAVSATRMHVMEEKKLHSDPCDRRMIRCNNCVFLLSCVCNCLSYVTFVGVSYDVFCSWDRCFAYPMGGPLNDVALVSGSGQDLLQATS
jgi:hypothetical protein